MERPVSSLHLLVSVSQEMVKTFYPDEAEARIFHVGDDVERDGQSSRKQKHMYPAFGAARGHAKAGEERTPETQAEEHRIDDMPHQLVSERPRTRC